MKHCEHKGISFFPVLSPGDTVEHKDGRVYLAVNTTIAPVAPGSCMVLCSLENGDVWSHTSLWGQSKPSDWTVVHCCFFKKRNKEQQNG